MGIRRSANAQPWVLVSLLAALECGGEATDDVIAPATGGSGGAAIGGSPSAGAAGLAVGLGGNAGDGGCIQACTPGSGFCDATQVTWECLGPATSWTADVKLLVANCTDAMTNLVRYCCSPGAVRQCSGGSGGTGGSGTARYGQTCTGNADCASGVCFDFAAVDPYCGGKACSVACSNTAECIQAATENGAPMPNSSTCASTGTCSIVGTGLGSFWCQ
jgi:hypothetical protein